MSRFLSLVCLCILIAGCASTTGSQSASAGAPADALDNLTDSVPGSSLEVEGISYTVMRSYTAASGRSCRQLRADAGILRVACRERRSGAAWYLRQALRSPPALTRSSAPLFMPRAAAQQSAAPDAGEADSRVSVINTDSAGNGATTSVAVLQDETLWRFAKRVTGNALNWERIAGFNDISDATALRAGQLLRIPSELPFVGTGN